MAIVASPVTALPGQLGSSFSLGLFFFHCLLCSLEETKCTGSKISKPFLLPDLYRGQHKQLSGTLAFQPFALSVRMYLKVNREM